MVLRVPAVGVVVMEEYEGYVLQIEPSVAELAFCTTPLPRPRNRYNAVGKHRERAVGDILNRPLDRSVLCFSAPLVADVLLEMDEVSVMVAY